jgi:hypothetical protein
MKDKRKLLVSIFVALLLIAGVIWFWGADTLFCLTVTYEGAGTEANPYEVSNVHQLQCIENQDLDANYVQVSDINASGTSSWNGGKGFDPIGGESSGAFSGKFDGQGYNITNLTIDRPNNSGGLFGLVGSSGIVTNVGLVDADIKGSHYVSSLVAFNRGTVSESYMTGVVDGTHHYVGGLVGWNVGTVTESYATGAVEGDEQVGGLVGWNFGTVTKSYATGAVDGSHEAGGLVGQNQNSTINSSGAGTINSSYATGAVNGDGVVGIAGSLVGHNVRGTIERSYATGAVSGSGFVGGLVGRRTRGTVTESYWDTQSTGQSSSPYGTGLTTAEMTGSAARGNMTGFDFSNTWRTVSGDYPALRKGATTRRER